MVTIAKACEGMPDFAPNKIYFLNGATSQGDLIDMVARGLFEVSATLEPKPKIGHALATWGTLSEGQKYWRGSVTVYLDGGDPRLDPIERAAWVAVVRVAGLERNEK